MDAAALVARPVNGALELAVNVSHTAPLLRRLGLPFASQVRRGWPAQAGADSPANSVNSHPIPRGRGALCAQLTRMVLPRVCPALYSLQRLY